MKFLPLLTLILTLQISTISAQKAFNIDGVEVPRTIPFKDENLSLNGGGTWSNVGVQALYLSQLSQDPDFIMEENTEMGFRIEITSSGLSPKKIVKIFNDSFEKSLGKNIEEVRPQIVEFLNCMSNEVNNKDIFQFIYSSNDSSIYVYQNDRLKCKIKGANFKKALFGIWLSEKSEEELKNQLLGK